MGHRFLTIAFWADLGTQCFLLLSCLLSLLTGNYFVSLTGLFFLGCWQLGSALMTGLILKDYIRIVYFVSAAGAVCLGTGLVTVLENGDVKSFFVIIGLVLSYLAGWVYFILQWHRRYVP